MTHKFTENDLLVSAWLLLPDEWRAPAGRQGPRRIVSNRLEPDPAESEPFDPLGRWDHTLLLREVITDYKGGWAAGRFAPFVDVVYANRTRVDGYHIITDFEPIDIVLAAVAAGGLCQLWVMAEYFAPETEQGEDDARPLSA